MKFIKALLAKGYTIRMFENANSDEQRTEYTVSLRFMVRAAWTSIDAYEEVTSGSSVDLGDALRRAYDEATSLGGKAVTL